MPTVEEQIASREHEKAVVASLRAGKQRTEKNERDTGFLKYTASKRLPSESSYILLTLTMV